MINHTQAAEDIRTLAGRYKGIMALADSLTGLGSIEQATSEAIAAREVAEGARDKARTDAAKAKNNMAAAEANAVYIGQEAKAQADDIVAKAQAIATSIEADARLKATGMTQSAGLKCAEMVEQANAQVAVIGVCIADAKAELAEAESGAEIAGDLADKAEAKLAKVQAAIRKLAEA